VDGGSTFLERILAERRRAAAELPATPARRPGPARPFARALQEAAARDGLAVVAEVKRASPSAGPLRLDLDPSDLARRYAAGGAAALSVLTEPAFFRAEPDDLPRAREAAGLPTLRKDFVVDRRQLAETVALGADAVLLIVAVLGEAVAGFVDEALDLGLEPLVEVHDEAELELALGTRARCIGINNRDLGTFRVDPATARRLAPRARAAGRVVVAESGIAGPEDVRDLPAAGVHAVLVGEALVRAGDPAARVRALREAARARPGEAAAGCS
jgi:indole-3-glycerol phosphate synthase